MVLFLCHYCSVSGLILSVVSERKAGSFACCDNVFIRLSLCIFFLVP